MRFVLNLVKWVLNRDNAFKMVGLLSLYRIKWVRRRVKMPDVVPIKDSDISLVRTLHAYLGDLYYYGLHLKKDHYTLKVIEAVGERSKVFWDIGADTGLESFIATQSNKDIDIIAFEPNPYSFDVLNRNLKINQSRSANVKALPYALCDVDGDISFHISKERPIISALSSKEGFDEVKVKGFAGDSLVANEGVAQPDAIKIDVEGFEDQVITGLKETVNTIYPTMIIEVLTEEAGKRVEDVLPEGYKYYGILEESATIEKKDKLYRLTRNSMNYLLVHDSRAHLYQDLIA